MKISTIQKKQIVGITGLAMVGFVLAHLSGNFLIFKGPEAFNAYAKFLHDLGGLLWVARIGLIASFLIHIGMTIHLTILNKKARGKRYYKYQNHRDERGLSTRLMPLTGTIMMVYIIMHLMDFTLADKVGVINGVDYGLYGLVVNTLSDPIHSLIYIIAMAAVGSHVFHGVQSVCQTFGAMSQKTQNNITKLSQLIGVGVFVGFSSIPLYIMYVL